MGEGDGWADAADRGGPDHDVESLSDRVGVLAGQIHALQAELVDVLADLDAADGLNGSGLRPAQWLSVRSGFTPSESRRLCSVAQRRDDLPILMEHARSGRVSVGMLHTATRVVDDTNEAAVADVVLACTPSQAGRVLSHYRRLAGSGGDDDPTTSDPGAEPAHWWRMWWDEAGRGRVDAALDATTAALLEQAWEAARAAGEREDRPEDPDPDRMRRLTPDEIAGRMASTVLDHAHAGGLRAPGGERFAVQVTVDLATLSDVLGIRLDGRRPVRLGRTCVMPGTGHHLQDHELARIMCDTGVQVLVHDDGVPLWLGNEVRTATRQQRRALHMRSGGGCEFPGCTQTRYLDAHHVRPHASGGATSLPNLVLLCSHHHHELHRRGWRIVTRGDQRFTFWDGPRCLGSTGTAARPPGRPPDAARRPAARAPDPPPGIDATTTLSETAGEPMTAYALDVYLSGLLAA